MSLLNIDIAVLCGGKGSRVANVLGDIPKVLAPIEGRPYLDWLIDKLKNHGVKRMVLCAGHLSHKIIEWRETRSERDVEIVMSLEPRQEGTGGALRFARMALNTNPVMVINGDTIVNADLSEMVKYHGEAMGVTVLQARRFGAASDYRSAGHYLMSQAVLDDIVSKQIRSLEEYVHDHRNKRYWRSGVYYDIGSPGTLRRAGHFFESVLDVA